MNDEFGFSTYPPSVARREKRRTVAYVVVVVLFGSLILVPFVVANVVGNGIGHGLQRAFTPDGKGVAATKCSAVGRQSVAIAGTAHNDTATAVDYIVSVSVSDRSGHQIPEASAFVSNVAPGRTAQWTAATAARSGSGVTCTVSSVLRVRHPLF